MTNFLQGEGRMIQARIYPALELKGWENGTVSELINWNAVEASEADLQKWAIYSTKKEEERRQKEGGSKRRVGK